MFEAVETAKGVFESYGLLGLAVLGVGIMAYMTNRALRRHEDHCEQRYETVDRTLQDIRDLVVERTEANRQAMSDRSKEIFARIERGETKLFARMDKLDEKREHDKDEILRALQDRRVEEQGDAMLNAIGQLGTTIGRQLNRKKRKEKDDE